ncbi:MAG: hypothetical protein ACYCV6_02575 [Steroidobacteraceae bacterium]
MRVFCFLMMLPDRSPGLAPVARLALSREEAERHPLRVSQVREIDISTDPQLLDPPFAAVPGAQSRR